MSLEPVYGFWQGPLSTMERLCLTSFIKNGHKFHLYSYNRIKDLPEGVFWQDAEYILPEKQCFKLYGSYSSFSDTFRYCLMARMQGWWSDLDVVCLRPLEFSSEYAFLSEWPRGVSYATNAIFKVPRKSSMMSGCAWRTSCLPKPLPEDADAPVLWNGDSEKRGFCDAGWQLFHNEMMQFGLQEYVQPMTLHVGQPDEFLLGETVLNPHCYAIHFSAFGWRHLASSKDAKHPPECLYERLKAKYL